MPQLESRRRVAATRLKNVNDSKMFVVVWAPRLERVRKVKAERKRERVIAEPELRLDLCDAAATLCARAYT